MFCFGSIVLLASPEFGVIEQSIGIYALFNVRIAPSGIDCWMLYRIENDC